MLASHQPLNQVQQVVITHAHAGQRVDNFLLSMLKGLPKSRLYRIIRKGEVRVNKGRVAVSYKLVEGDTVRIPPIRLGEKGESTLNPSVGLTQLLSESILYEDDQLLVINKPAGLAVHGGSGVSLGLIEALRKLRPEASFLELVHRLDRDTSGCVMIAKRRSMLTHLHECLKTGQIKKHYYALVHGVWQGGKKVEAPLHKYLLKSGERMVKVDPEGKASRTNFRVVKSYAEFTLVQAKPITGRTHQIRVHCNYMGHPIVGDKKYGDPLSKARLFLHAHELIIQLPYKPFELIVSCPMPKELENYLSNLTKE